MLRARADSAAALGRPDWERQYLLQAVEIEPDHANDWARIGDASLAGFEGSVSQAIQAYEKCLALQPDFHEARLQWARALILQGDQNKSLQVLEATAETPEALALKAEALHMTDPDAAWPMILKAIDKAEEGKAPFLLAAQIAQTRGDWEAMAKMAHAAREKSPFEPSAAYLSAYAHGRLGAAEDRLRAETAFSLLKEYRELPPDEVRTFRRKLAILRVLAPDWVGSNELLKAAMLYFQIKSGRREEARATWETLEPTVGMLSEIEKRQLAALFVKVGWLSKARVLLRQIDAENETSMVLLRTELDFQDQQFDRVVESMTRRIQAGQELAPYYFDRGKAYLWKGDEAKAVADFEAALDLAPWFASYRIELAKLKLVNGETQVATGLLKAGPVANDPAIRAFMKEKGLGDSTP